MLRLSHKCPQISVFKVSEIMQLLKTESQFLNIGNQTHFDRITSFCNCQIHTLLIVNNEVTQQYPYTMRIHDCIPSQEKLLRPMCQKYIIKGLWVCMFVCLLSRFYRISLVSIHLYKTATFWAKKPLSESQKAKLLWEKVKLFQFSIPSTLLSAILFRHTIS